MNFTLIVSNYISWEIEETKNTVLKTSEKSTEKGFEADVSSSEYQIFVLTTISSGCHFAQLLYHNLLTKSSFNFIHKMIAFSSKKMIPFNSFEYKWFDENTGFQVKLIQRQQCEALKLHIVPAIYNKAL